MKNKNKQDLLQELSLSFNRWDTLYSEGGSDPFCSDGSNLNLVRNHIIYYKRIIEEIHPELMESDIYMRQTPKEVSNNYMAKADNIRENAKRTLNILKNDENYLYLCEHLNSLSEVEARETLIHSVLGYFNSLRIALNNDDLVVMRRYKEPERYFSSFSECRKRVEKILNTSNRQMSLF